MFHRIREDDMSKWHFFFLLFGQLMRHPLIELFHLSNLLQMLNDHIVVDVKFLGNFSCSCKRINFDDPFSWSLSTCNDWPLHSSSSELLSPLQNSLSHHCIVCLLVPGPDVVLILQVVSSAFLWTQIRKSLEFDFCLTSFP